MRWSRRPPIDEAVLLGGRDASSKLARQAPVFAPLVERFGPARVRPGGEPFAALASAIASQQLSVKAAATVFGRLEEQCDGHVTAEAVAKLSTDALRSCGFSKAKVSYLQDLAERTLAGSLPLDQLDQLDDHGVVDTLTEVKGIGEWTAHMVLIFDLHRPDVLATGDLGVRDGVRVLLDLDELPDPATVEALAEPWKPYRSLACWYLWKERDRVVRRGAAP